MFTPLGFHRISFAFFLISLQLAEPVYVMEDHVLSDGVGGHCGETISSKESVFLKSHMGASMFGGLTTYDADTDCTVTFVADAGKRILVKFPFFDLPAPSDDTCSDWLQLSEGPEEDPTTIAATEAPQPTTTPAPEGTGTHVTGTAVTGTAATGPAVTGTAATGPADTGTAASSSEAATTLPPTNTPTSSPVVATTGTTVQGDTTGATSEPHMSTSADTNNVDITRTLPPEQPDTSKICEKPNSYTSTSSHLTVRFVTDSSTQRKGFNLLLTSFHTGPCTDSEFQCDTDRCISSILTCDGNQHCLDGSDESKEKAKCSVLDKVIGSVTSMGSLVVLGIAIVVVAIIFTVVTMIILWKYIKGDASCKSDTPDDEEAIPVVKATEVKPKKQESKPTKQKKTVTIGHEESKSGATPVESAKTHTGIRKSKVSSTSTDVEW